MTRPGTVLVAAIALVSAAAAAAADPACDTCTSEPPAPAIFEHQDRPLTIEIESGLQFGRMALRGQADGAARLDPGSGQSRVETNLIELGGAAFQGRVR